MSRLTVAFQLIWIIQFLSIPAFGFTKISVIFFYRRIFVCVKRFLDITKWFAIFIAVWTTCFFFLGICESRDFSSSLRGSADTLSRLYSLCR